MQKVKNVFSAFDGMSCGQIALNKVGIVPENYHASEIDKYAMKVTMANYPGTIQMGDITKIKGSGLPTIDLMIGGSPCQGFSFAGNGLNFDDPRSKLFFEYVRLKNELNPRYFLLENVKMKQQHQDVISNLLGVSPVLINSSLVSAQNRERLYWTNIPLNGMPTNKGIVLQDVLESGHAVRNKSQTILSTLYKENAKSMLTRNKAGLLVKMTGSENTGNIFYADNVNDYTLSKKHAPVNGEKVGWRKFTPLECERLQNVPDNYTAHVSDTQRYKMLGNGWTVDVIAHVLQGINNSVYLFWNEDDGKGEWSFTVEAKDHEQAFELAYDTHGPQVENMMYEIIL